MLKKNTFLWLYVALLAAIPFSWWNSSFYLIGGDDLKYEFVDPLTKIESIISDPAFSLIRSISGLLTEVSSFPFYCALYFFKKIFPFINTQQLIYSLIFSVGFTSFYWLLGICHRLIGAKIIPGSDFYLRFIVANLYIFSPFLIVTMWSGQLPCVMLIASLPLVMALIIESILDFSWPKILLASVLTTIFPSPYGSIPWVLPTLICALPIISFFILKYCKQSFLNFGLFFFITFVLNFPTWIVSFGISAYSADQFSSTALQDSMLVFSTVNKGISFFTTIGLIPSQSFLLKLLSPFNNRPSLFIFLSSFATITILALFIATLLLSILKKTLVSWPLIISFFCSALLSYLLVSGGGGDIGTNILIRLMNYLPFLSMFRNSFDKFSIAAAFFPPIWIYFSFILINQYLSCRKNEQESS